MGLNMDAVLESSSKQNMHLYKLISTDRWSPSSADIATLLSRKSKPKIIDVDPPLSSASTAIKHSLPKTSRHIPHVSQSFKSIGESMPNPNRNHNLIHRTTTKQKRVQPSKQRSRKLRMGISSKMNQGGEAGKTR